MHVVLYVASQYHSLLSQGLLHTGLKWFRQHQIKRVAMGLPLPDELVELTFNYLDIPSLLKCMQVSL